MISALAIVYSMVHEISVSKVIVTGFKEVEFGNKEWAKCLKSANVGYLGTNGNPELTQEHVAPCISWFLGADWMNNFA